MKSQQTMRDAFWDRIYELAKNDRDIVIVSADFGAPSLDKFRKDFPLQYINVGISEQNAILVATGLALAGKKTIAYAITQFITLRCYEQIRIYPCGMNLPVTIVGVGAGACYWESGATHHCFEQLSIMRALPNLKTINCSDQLMARRAADFAVSNNGPKFIQLDREIIDGLYENEIDFKKGYKFITKKEKNMIIATGNMVKEALTIRQDISNNDLSFGIIDVFSLPLEYKSFLEDIKGIQNIITLEENTKEGGLGSYILEIACDNDLNVKIKRIGLNTYKGYEGSYNYGGREAIRNEYGMGKENIISTIQSYFG